MENNKNKPTITVKISNIKLKVIRFGETSEMGLWADGRDLSTEVHTHLTYEAIFVTDGKLEVRTYEGNMCFERGIVVIPPDLNHYTIPSQMACFCVLFTIDASKHDISKAEYINDYLKKGISTFELSDDVAYYIRAFVRKSNENTYSAERDASLLAELIFREIISFIIPIEPDGGAKSESWCIGAVEGYINAHIREKIKLSDIANYVYMSDKQISRIIMREYKMPLSELIVKKKLHIAQMLLQKTDLKINEIAARVNVGMENYFYTLFKKNYGISPLEYRKKYRAECKKEEDK